MEKTLVISIQSWFVWSLFCLSHVEKGISVESRKYRMRLKKNPVSFPKHFKLEQNPLLGGSTLARFLNLASCWNFPAEHADSKALKDCSLTSLLSRNAFFRANKAVAMCAENNPFPTKACGHLEVLGIWWWQQQMNQASWVSMLNEVFLTSVKGNSLRSSWGH